MTAEGAQEWEWPDSLDALVAAPQNHRLLFVVGDTEIRMLAFEVGR